MIRRRSESDGDSLRSWILERVDAFPPLHIVDASSAVDEDSDGEPTFVLTLLLDPPPGEDEPWSLDAVLSVERAVEEWARANGYAVSPHVHLQSTDPADAA